MLEVSLSGVRFKNPFLLASGVLGITPGLLKRAERSGAGGVVTKTITLEPRRGHVNPVLVELDVGMLNSMGLPNPGVEYFMDVITRARELLEVPLIASIGPSSVEEAEKLSTNVVKGGADMIELNASCPHVERHGLEILSDRKLISEIIGKVKDSVPGTPLLVKVSAMTDDICSLASTILDAGADGIVAINTIRAMAIDIHSQKPILGGVYGGLSGPALKPIAVRCIYEIYEEFPGSTIVGVGGIKSWEDAVEFFLAGASAVQVGTGIAYRGLEIFRELTEGIEKYLAHRGYKSIGEIVGLAHS